MSGLTTTGFDIKSLQLLIEEINTQMKANIDANLNTESDAVAGQVTGIVSNKLREIWELALAVWQGASPDTASGQSLSYLAQITGTIRLAATDSTVETFLLLAQGTVLPAGSALYPEGDPDSRYELTADHTQAGISLGSYTYDDGGGTPNSNGEATPNGASPSLTTSIGFFDSDAGGTDRSAALLALVAGDYITTQNSSDLDGYRVTGAPSDITAWVSVPVEYVGGVDSAYPYGTASPSEITTSDDILISAATAGSYTNATTLDTATIATPVTGWEDAFFIADSADGTDEETDAELRIRRIIELSAPGSATVNAMRADLLDEAAVAQSNITTADVFENATGLVDSNGLPPHSVEVLVNDDGVTLLDPEVLVQQIFDAKPAGTETYGSLSDTATDDGGVDHTVWYSIPTDVQTWVDLTLEMEAELYVGDQVVAEAIEAWADGLVLGENVYASDIINIVADLAGVISITPSSVKVDNVPSPAADELITTARQLATIAAADVDVTST